MYLKWVGGKTSLSDSILPNFPKSFKTYVEPFTGSAALYFCFARKHQTSTASDLFYQPNYPSNIHLYDINPHLINTHIQVRDNPEQVIQYLQQLEAKHNSAQENVDAFYKHVRTTVTHDITNDNKAELAAQFIYINKTCFNGIWRVNKSGKNNVPYNKKDSITFDIQTITLASTLLKNTHISHQSCFDVNYQQLDDAFVYLDPPYYPLSKTSNFAAYNKEKQDDKQLLQQLKQLCDTLTQHNVKFMMSNSTANEVFQMFEGYNIKTLDAHRFVKAITKKQEKREKVQETLVTNYSL